MRPRVVHALMAVVCMLAASWASAALPADTTEITGEWQGALYAMYVPASWNGDLVLYAHGWTDPTFPVSLPGYIEPFRDILLTDGYAVAYSSFSKSGMAVREGFKQTEHLLPMFISEFGQPDHVYVIGHSMGGLISVMLAEKDPGKIDGAMPICGIVGGEVMTMDYFGDLRVLFDAYFPDVIPGSLYDVPDDIDVVNDVIVPALGAVFSNPDATVEMAAVEQLDLYWTDPVELGYSIAYALSLLVRATEDVVDICGGSYFENTAPYTHPNPPVITPPVLTEHALNEFVERYSFDPRCLAFITTWYEPTGKLRVPVLTLHETRDYIAPLEHELEYASRVAAQGNSEWLVQRTEDAWGHCVNISEAEAKAAFDELVLWVEEGVKPAP